MANRVLVDANVIVAAVLPNDPHHGAATQFIGNFAAKGAHFFTNSYILSETFTITLIRSKSMEAVSILEKQFFVNGAINVFTIPASWHNDIVRIFLSQKKYKGEFLSFADSSLIIQARKQKISTILTFDKTFDQFKREFDLPCGSK